MLPRARSKRCADVAAAEVLETGVDGSKAELPKTAAGLALVVACVVSGDSGLGSC